MNVKKKTNISHSAAYRRDKEKPIISYKEFYVNGFCSVKDKHVRGQLLYPEYGLIKVFCSNHYWLIPPEQIIWIPPFVRHQVFAEKDISINYVFLDHSVCDIMPRDISIYDLNILVKELIKRSELFSDNYEPDSAEYRLALVILDEFKKLKPAKFYLPYGKDKRVVKVIDELKKRPGCRRTIEYYSKIACTSTRNLNRLFVKDTGMTFSGWRKQQRILVAIEKLYNKLSVSNIALELGYKSISAFIESFKEATGKTPGSYFS